MKTRKKSQFSYSPILLAILFLSLFIVLPGCKGKSPPEKAPGEAKPAAMEAEDINLKETRLATVPEDYEVLRVVLSADGSRVAYVAREGGKQFVVVGDEPGLPYDAVYTDTLVWSRDGQRLAYSGKKEGKWYLVLDGKEKKNPYEDTGSIVFSPDGRMVAYEAKEEGKWFIVVWDGARETLHSGHYDFSYSAPVFSPDSRRVLYVLRDDDEQTHTVFLVDTLTGKVKRTSTYESVGSFTFNADSHRFTYLARGQGKSFIVLSGFAQDEERKMEFPYTRAVSFVLSPDGKKIAYSVTRGGKHFLVESPWESPAKGKESGPYEGIRGVDFIPGSTRTAYLAMKEGRWSVVVGDREGMPYDSIRHVTPVFSPDGAMIAYPAMIKHGKWGMVVSPSSKPEKVSEGPAYDMVVTPVFSPDGRYIVYRAREGAMEEAKRFIVIADTETGKVIREGLVQDEVWPPVWSADGKEAAYGARQGRELWWRVESVE